MLSCDFVTASRSQSAPAWRQRTSSSFHSPCSFPRDAPLPHSLPTGCEYYIFFIFLMFFILELSSVHYCCLIFQTYELFVVLFPLWSYEVLYIVVDSPFEITKCVLLIPLLKLQSVYYCWYPFRGYEIYFLSHSSTMKFSYLFHHALNIWIIYCFENFWIYEVHIVTKCVLLLVSTLK